MMRAVFINGSPRRNWCTHQMLESAMRGAEEAGAEVETIHLYDDAFRGCVSCFACKLRDNRTGGLCAYRDALTPVLERALRADVIVIGTPIYLSFPTGPVRSFMERLVFPLLTYNPETDPETGEVRSSLLDRRVATATIYTMGCPEEMMAECHYPEIFAENDRFLEMIFGYTESLCTNNSHQFDDYSKYDVAEYAEPMRARYREERYPDDLRRAYEMGARLVSKAREFRE